MKWIHFFIQMYLTELASYEKEGIEGQLNHATCIINALSDIKPEIENVIKMGRKIVESEAVVQVTWQSFWGVLGH